MNKTKAFSTLAVTLLFPLAVYAQTPAAKQVDQPYIEVTGTAEKEVIPDEIYISIVIKEKYSNKEKVTIEVQEEKLRNAIKALGIDLSNLTLSDANADYVKIRWQRKDVLTKKDYLLKVTDATTVGKVFMELEKLEIKDAWIARVHHSQMDSLRKEVKILAIKAAKAKADYLLAAIGEQTGKPVIVKEAEISETRTRNTQSVMVNTSRHRYSDGDFDKSSLKDDEIEFRKIKIDAGVYVKFLIR
jgi:uncharacterized protein YggE